MINGYLSVNDLSEMWGIQPRTIQIMCADGKIPGATKFGRSWAIPDTVERPADGRETTGEYKNWRKTKKEYG